MDIRQDPFIFCTKQRGGLNRNVITKKKNHPAFFKYLMAAIIPAIAHDLSLIFIYYFGRGEHLLAATFLILLYIETTI